MFEWKEKASNAILLDDNVGGKGKTFRTRFLQAGLVKYSFGVCLLEKETIDRFVYQFEGCPVIINHKDVTSESAKDDRVGVISKVEYNQYDGWYWAEGVIFDQEALNLIDKGYNVSCQYEITEYSVNKEGKLHNGNEYDKVILNGRPEHLAIVENPRYENAMIAVNVLEVKMAQNEDKFVSVGPEGDKHPIHIDMLKDKSNKDKEKKEKDNKKDKKENKSKFEEIYQKMITPQVEKQLTDAVKAQKADNPEAQIGDTIIDSDRIISLYTDKLSTEEYKNFNWDKAEDALFDKLKEIEKEKGFKTYKKEQEATQLKLKLKNDIIQAINEIKENSMFKNLFKKEEKMDREEIKSIFMECLTELTASNEAEKKEEVKEEVKEEKEEVAENKCKNEEPDYKKMYEELKAEKEAKNEAEKEENEKAKNAIMEGEVKVKSTYITERRAIELGKELF